jgi:hypothetical protein
MYVGALHPDGWNGTYSEIEIVWLQTIINETSVYYINFIRPVLITILWSFMNIKYADMTPC